MELENKILCINILQMTKITSNLIAQLPISRREKKKKYICINSLQNLIKKGENIFK